MRTTVDLPDELLKQAKLKAIEEGISLKELFIRCLENELGAIKNAETSPWKNLSGTGTAVNLNPKDSGFIGYTGP